MSDVRVRFERERERCPFCHDSIALEGDEWVACKQCLARHHAGCWREGGRCASCQGEAVLAEVARPGTRPGTGVVPRLIAAPPAPAPAAPLRPGLRGPLRMLADASLGYVTLGVFPALAGEWRLSKHLALHADAARAIGASSPERARQADDARTKGLGGALRCLLPFLLIGLGYVFAFAAMFASGIFKDFPDGPPPDIRHLPPLGIIVFLEIVQFFAIAPAGAALHLFREAVKRHESQWLAVATDPERARELEAQASKDWRDRRLLDALFTVLGFVPFFGVVFSFVLSARVSGALELHEEHEAALDEGPKPRVKPAKLDKGDPAP